jgi:tetratricopeptide (TPR) repeat protein
LALSITERFPDHQFAWKVLGSVLKQSDRISESLCASQKSVQLAPQDAEAHNNLGDTLKELGRLDGAEAIYVQAIALKPDFAEAHCNLDLTLKELGRLDESAASFRQAIGLKPDFGEAKHMLAALSGDITATAPRDYVEGLFDNYADKFERSLVDNLEYKSPRVIAEMIIKDSEFDLLGSITDLGFGIWDVALACLEWKLKIL